MPNGVKQSKLETAKSFVPQESHAEYGRIKKKGALFCMVKQTIQDQLKDAMRAKDAMKLETLRFVLSQIRYVEIDKKADLTDEEAIEVLSREVKKRKDAIEMFTKSGRDQIVAEEEQKLLVIMALLPAQLSSEEVEKIVDEVVSTLGKENMGMVMKEVMGKVKGKADGKMVSDLVRKKLS